MPARKTSAEGPNIPEEELRLWKRYARTREEEIRNYFLEKYLPTVRYVAERLLAKLPQSVELDDLVSAGIFGLMQAIDGFDVTRGVKFETYCVNRIRGAILDELRNLDWVPRLVRTKAHKISNAASELKIKLGRDPSDAELAVELGLTIKEYDEMVREASAITILSLSEKAQHGDDDKALTKLELVENAKGEPPMDDIQRRELIEFLTKGLSKKEKLIMILYYYEELTMREIGSIIDLSESRVCQIHSKIVMRLKAQLDSFRHELMA
ncbi:MAG: FliA/WhiG family RNA polymerase sigma factor [Planctomycetota bacterium]|nr:MAG: FliA/WhiG family RNA polymerase sigma factor [Planctomycetota bacterium]